MTVAPSRGRNETGRMNSDNAMIEARQRIAVRL
jgi:hypothetical protein